MTDFTLARSNSEVRFAGYGAQYNQNLFAKISRDAGVAETTGLVKKLRLLKPQLVRVFFNGSAFTDQDLMQSFKRTMTLAQQTATTINVTFQGIGPRRFSDKMPQFADVLTDLVTGNDPVTGKTKIDKLNWVTIRNEPNRPAMPQDLYRELYRQLDTELRRRKVRSKIGFMGGDLLQNNQKDWFEFLAKKEMTDLLGAYSIHVYWNYWSPGKIETRLKGVHDLLEGLPAARAIPRYVTEYGARGIAPADGKADPGLDEHGRPLGETNVYAFQHAWFALRAAMLGFCGAVKWDAYFSMYDTNEQGFALIGKPPEWRLQPVYQMMRLLTTTVTVGSRIVPGNVVPGTATSGSRQLVVGFVSPAKGWTVLGLDTGGAKLETTSPEVRTYRLRGLPKSTEFQLRYWNFDGHGQITTRGRLNADSTGAVTVTAPLHSIFAIVGLQPH